MNRAVPPEEFVDERINALMAGVHKSRTAAGSLSPAAWGRQGV